MEVFCLWMGMCARVAGACFMRGGVFVCVRACASGIGGGCHVLTRSSAEE
jgi:hypothetical protein